MVLKPEPIFEAVEQIKEGVTIKEERPLIILMTPQGRLFSQAVARELSLKKHLILICGHYEGVDERVQEQLATDEISIGDYVLSGGEPAAMVVVDAVARLIPGVLGSEESLKDDCWNIHNIPARRYSGDGMCLKYFFPATMPGLQNGVASSLFCVP
jgi:tRNA (guanine37-N1)-methyltransferase